MSQEGNRHSCSSISFILILLLVLIAFGLRLLYVTRISLYIDEFTSIWATKLILEKGLPLTPAGVIYHRGIFFSYVMALSGYLFGFSEEAGRMSSVFIAVITVPCLYLVGRGMFSDRSGLLAAAFLTFAPQAVVWGARARMYALLQLLSLLAVYSLYVGVVESKRDTYLYLFAICFCGALFTQEQAVLLYPALLLAVIALGRWRWFLRPRGISVNAFCCLAIMSRYLLDLVGRPTQFELVQDAGLPSGFVEGLMASCNAYLSFFLHPDQVFLTVLFGAGLIYALREITTRGRVLEAARKRWLESLAFLSLVFALIALEMFIAGGARWSDPRYFFMILPLFILGASGSLDRILALMWERLPTAGSDDSYSGIVRIPSWPVLCSLVGMIAVVYVPRVNSIMSQQIEGHDRAMEYVGGHWQEGDVIITASPPVCAVYLDHCDYFAMQKGYEGYVIDRGGQTVDVWTGTPLLNSVDRLKETLRILSKSCAQPFIGRP
jgi:4-amino-4-deoxy-L-arabinose transferase-like glycosyltransferase